MAGASVPGGRRAGASIPGGGKPALGVLGQSHRFGGVSSPFEVELDKIRDDFEQVHGQTDLGLSGVPSTPRVEEVTFAPHLDVGASAGCERHLHAFDLPVDK
jgi:hypothetical protein